MNQEEAARTLILLTAASRSHWKFRTVEERYYKYFIQIISCWSYKYFVQSKNAITGEHKFCGLVHLDVTAYCTKFAVICIQFPNSVTPLHSHPPHMRQVRPSTLHQFGSSHSAHSPKYAWPRRQARPLRPEEAPSSHPTSHIEILCAFWVQAYPRLLIHTYTAIILEQVQSILVHPFALYTWSTWLTSAPFFKSNSTVGM